MLKFKVGDIVTGTEKSEGLYKISKDTEKDYEVFGLSWQLEIYEDKAQPYYKGVPYACYTPHVRTNITINQIRIIKGGR